MKKFIVEVTSEESLCFQDDVNAVINKMRETINNHLSLTLDNHELFLLSLTKIGELQFSDELPEGMSSDPANTLINRLRRCIKKNTALRFTDEEYFIFSLTEYGKYLGLEITDESDDEQDEQNEDDKPVDDEGVSVSLDDDVENSLSSIEESNKLATNSSKINNSNCQKTDSRNGKDASIKPK